MSYICIIKCRTFANKVFIMRKTLEYKIRLRIKKSKAVAFVLADFLDLSDRDQVGRVLRKLVAENTLLKIGMGIFAKCRRSSFTNKIILEKDLGSVAREALNKLKIKTLPSSAELNYNDNISTQIPTGLMIGVTKRVSRTISYNGKSIKYERIPV